MKTLKKTKTFLKVLFLSTSLFFTGIAHADSHDPTNSLIENWSSELTVAIDPIAGRITSFKQVILDSDFQDAKIYVDANITSQSSIKSLILKQLKYLVGQLRMLEGQAEVAKTQIDILQQGPADHGYKLVRYRFRTRISWDRAKRIPQSLEVILPAYGSGSGHERFFSTYGHDCSEEEPTLDNFFYHYMPLKSGCPLKAANFNDETLFFRFHGKLVLSPTNTENKSPEYSQVWKDGKLIVTAMYSKYESHATSDEDAGIAAYNQTYLRLQQVFGAPTSISENFSGTPGAAHPSIEMRFNSRRGEVIVYLRLVNRLSSESSSFVKWYESKTPQSDLVLYNGHAGLGANVSRLAKIGKFTPGQYQIFFINGCTTFSYVNMDLWKLHGAANPGVPASKHLEIIMNSEPSYFNKNDDATIVMMQSMIEARGTYREVLSKIDPRQRALVDGEEDNP